MIVVVAGQGDKTARSFVARHPTQSIFLSPADLSVSGWSYRPGHAADSTLVASGKRLRAGDITGIWNRLTWVLPRDLTDIKAEDRRYAATEMTAFLISWLSEVPCPVLNRPATAGQSGASWSCERWQLTAAQLGLPVRSVLCHVTGGAEPFLTGGHGRCVKTTVIGDSCIDEADPSRRENALRLAHTSRLNLLSIHYSHPQDGALFLHVDARPDVAAESAVEHSVMRYLAAEGALTT